MEPVIPTFLIFCIATQVNGLYSPPFPRSETFRSQVAHIPAREQYDKIEVLDNDSRTAEAALFQAIMGNYKPHVRPVRYLNESLIVVARLFPIKIQSLKERDEILSMTLRLQLGWSDSSLVWDPADFGGLDRIVVNAYDLWLPDLQIANSAEDMYQLMRDRQFAVKIHNDGKIWWHPTGSVKIRCELDLRYFPFDLQRCPITLESVIHTVQQLNLTVRPGRAPVSFSMYTENGVWELILATGQTNSYFVSMHTAFSRVSFLLYLHRRTSYYKLNIIFPCAMLSGLQLLTFLLPLNNQERVPQSTTILLSVVVFQTVVVEELPRTSNSLSLLSMYISLLTGISVASVADSVAIAYLISLRDRAFQVPRWLAIILRLICHYKFAPKHREKLVSVKSSNLFENNRSSLTVKSRLIMDHISPCRRAPLACMDDFADVNERRWSNCRHQQQTHRSLSPVSTYDEQLMPGRTSKMQQPSRCYQLPHRADVNQGNYQQFQSIPNSNSNNSFGNEIPSENASLYRTNSPVLQRRGNNSSGLGCNGRSRYVQKSSGSKASDFGEPYLKSFKNDHEIVFVRWFKVARIINAAVFLICLMLIIFVPIILFVWTPPDVSQYKNYSSPLAVIPPTS